MELKIKISAGKKIIIIIFLLIFTIILSVGIYTALSNFKYTNITTTTIIDSKQEIISNEMPIAEYSPAAELIPPALQGESGPKEITNIALFGLDRRGDETSRTDTIMIVSVDRYNKKIKLTSLMRDMYVDIPGRGGDRINHAYAYGGPEVAINTINKNFDMDIKYYATVDFKGVQMIINKIGGVNINVKEGEIKYLNSNLHELNGIDEENIKGEIAGSGIWNLSGKQALAYMRIRYYGDADYERTQRQRTVLTELLDRVKISGIFKYPELVSAVLPYVETNISKVDILTLGLTALGFRNNIEQYRLPVDNMFSSQSIRGMSVLVPDMEANKKQLHKFIYEETKGVPATN